MLQPTVCLASGTDPATVQPAMQLRGAWSMLTRWSVMLARVLEGVEARRRVRKEHAHTLHEGAICQFMVLRGPSPWRRLKPRPGRSVSRSRRLAELWLLGYMPYRLKSSQSASPPIREGKVLGSSTRAPTASGVDLPAVPDSSLSTYTCQRRARTGRMAGISLSSESRRCRVKHAPESKGLGEAPRAL